MGFFDFLKKSEEKEETKEVEKIRLSELGSWLEASSKQVFENVQFRLKEIKERVEEEKTFLKQNLAILENAELKNQNIGERAIQIMHGNRAIYLQKVEAFTAKINFPEDIVSISDFFIFFDKELENFDRAIGKNHLIMEEFFAEKASTISRSMRNIDKAVKDAKSAVENSDIGKVNEIKNKIIWAEGKIRGEAQTKEKIKSLEKVIKEGSKKIKETENKISLLKQEQEYKEITEALKDKEVFSQKLSETNSKLKHSFSEIESALKKYENLSENKLVRKYLEDSLSALLEDKELEILVIIEAIKTAIASSEITLKDKKKDKVTSELSKMNGEFFREFLTRRAELSNRLSENTAEIENSQILKEITEFEISLSQDKTNLEDKKLNLGKMKNDFEETNISDLTKSLEFEIKDKLGLDVKII